MPLLNFFENERTHLEKQRVLCLNCSTLREQNLARLDAQLAQLERGENTLLLEELNKKKIELQQKLSRFQALIAFSQDKANIRKVIENKQRERARWEARKIWETLKITNEYSSLLCGCGCTLGFPARKDRAYGTRKFISAKQNELYWKKKKEKEELVNGLAEKGIDVKVLGKSKVARSLGHNDTSAPEKTKEIEIYEESEKNRNEK